MQPKVAQLTIKMGGGNRPLCAKIKAQKHKRGLNMDITTANRLYELRKQHGYSQDELAESSTYQVKQYPNGKDRRVLPTRTTSSPLQNFTA